MASTRPVDSNSVDWTCICVGRSDGIVNFYTERGICIFYERAAHSSIRAIRFGASIYPGNQELVLLSAENKIVIFEGLLLFTVLKTARNQVLINGKYTPFNIIVFFTVKKNFKNFAICIFHVKCFLDCFRRQNVGGYC